MNILVRLHLSPLVGLTALVQRLFVHMLVTMWLLLVHGKQECLGVGPVCDMGLPRFQQGGVRVEQRGGKVRSL